MKAKFLLTILGLLFTLLCAARKSIPMIGTWKMISGSMSRGDSTFTDDMTKTEAMKIVTPTHFAIFSKNIADGKLLHAGAGTIKVNGDHYTEVLSYVLGEGFQLPITAEFTFKIEGDKWYHKGSLLDMKFDEVWQRIK